MKTNDWQERRVYGTVGCNFSPFILHFAWRQLILPFNCSRYWNLVCGLFHLFQAILVLGLGLNPNGNAVKFKLPLTTLFLDWSRGFPVQVLVKQANLPFVAVTSGFSWMSAVAHFTVLIFFGSIYIPDLRRGMNRFRWVEYAFSSSLMIGLIAMLFGMYDIISLVLIMSVNACMNLFGYLMETTNVMNKKDDWTPFYFGCKLCLCERFWIWFINITRIGLLWILVWIDNFRNDLLIRHPLPSSTICCTYIRLFINFTISSHFFSDVLFSICGCGSMGLYIRIYRGFRVKKYSKFCFRYFSRLFDYVQYFPDKYGTPIFTGFLLVW